MSVVIEYHIIQSLPHDIMLGFDWLRTCNPYIDSWACTLLVQVPGGHSFLDDLPCDSIAHVKLASLDSVCKDVDHGAFACFTFIRAAEPPDAMGACVSLASWESGDA